MIDCKGTSSAGAGVAADDEHLAAGADQPGLDRNVQTRIGSHLRAMYDELMQQPIPDRFIDLLANLDRPGRDAPSKVDPKSY
ncbi:MAG: NepR family anti-sigma factor [Methylobacterium frigidaeris]